MFLGYETSSANAMEQLVKMKSWLLLRFYLLLRYLLGQTGPSARCCMGLGPHACRDLGLLGCMGVPRFAPPHLSGACASTGRRCRRQRRRRPLQALVHRALSPPRPEPPACVRTPRSPESRGAWWAGGVPSRQPPARGGCRRLPTNPPAPCSAAQPQAGGSRWSQVECSGGMGRCGRERRGGGEERKVCGEQCQSARKKRGGLKLAIAAHAAAARRLYAS
jgi:hypothetical protein